MFFFFFFISAAFPFEPFELVAQWLLSAKKQNKTNQKIFRITTVTATFMGTEISWESGQEFTSCSLLVKDSISVLLQLISCGWIYEKLKLNYKRVHVCGRLYINEAQLKTKREVFLVIVLTLALKSAGLWTASVFGSDFVCWWLECTSSLWLRGSRGGLLVDHIDDRREIKVCCLAC